MNLNIYQETKPVSGSNHLVAAIYDATAPLVVVASFPFPGPYTGQTQLVTFPGLDPIDYIYICWESATTAPGGTSRNNFNVQPSTSSFTIREDLFLEADVSAFLAGGTNFYGQDASLIGWDWYTERVSQGSQTPGTDFVKTIAGVDTGNSDTNADGWRLGVSGDLIGTNEKFVIHFYPQANTASPVAAKIISSTVILSVNTAMDNTYLGKSVLLQGSGGFFNVTLPDISTCGDSKPIFFLSSGGSHINVAITCFTGQTFQWLTGTQNKIILAQSEQLMIYKLTFPDTSTKWIVAQISDTVRMVGELILSHAKTEINTLFIDGTQGLSRSNYARLWAWVQANPGFAVTAAVWAATAVIDGKTYNTGHGFFSQGDGSTTFGLPKLYEYGFLRLADGVTVTPGGLQTLMLLTHRQDSLTGALVGRPNGFGPSRTVGKYGGTVTSVTDLSGLPYNDPGANTAGTPIVRVGPENRPDNIGIYASIRF